MSTSWRHRAASHPKALDLAVLLLLFAVTVTGVLVTRALDADPLELWPGIALSALACAALSRRRHHPLPVLAVTALCTVAVGALGYLLTPLLMGPLLVAQYETSLRVPRRAGWNSALIVTGCVVVSGLVFPSFLDSVVFAVVNPTAWILLCAALGGYRRVRREYAVARAEHADRQREEEARHRVVQERMRIARELHDVVAHHLTLADAQAGAVKHLLRTRPDQAEEIIDRLPETTAAALRELKATVGLLRQDTDPADDLAPAPGLDRLPDLVDSCAAAGLQVTVTVEGERRPLTPVLDLTAYRILQEALTNVTKHGAGRTAEVRLAFTPRRLTLTVTNDTAADPARARADARGRVPSGPAGGFGLISMRERATATGGTFHAGHRARGRFQVVCALPLDPSTGGGLDLSLDPSAGGLDLSPDHGGSSPDRLDPSSDRLDPSPDRRDESSAP